MRPDSAMSVRPCQKNGGQQDGSADISACWVTLKFLFNPGTPREKQYLHMSTVECGHPHSTTHKLINNPKQPDKQIATHEAIPKFYFLTGEKRKSFLFIFNK